MLAGIKKKKIANLTYIRGHQLLTIINTGHTDLPLADKWEVVGVGGDEESLWKTKRCASQIKASQHEHTMYRTLLTA